MTEISPPLIGDIVYRDTDDSLRHFPIHAEDPYVAMDSMSRMQLKILGLYLSELQDQIRLRTSKRSRVHPYNIPADMAARINQGAPDGPA